jgi:hypothetical protein
MIKEDISKIFKPYGMHNLKNQKKNGIHLGINIGRK